MTSTPHQIEAHTDCTSPLCRVCEFNLRFCSVCGLIENNLTTDCPRSIVPMEFYKYIRQGLLDFKGGSWASQYPLNESFKNDMKRQYKKFAQKRISQLKRDDYNWRG
jgi:hypothetical protein